MTPIPHPLRWVFFDVGDTMIFLDVDRVAARLREFGIHVVGPELLQAQARVRPLVDRAVLDRLQRHHEREARGDGGHLELLHESDEAFLRWMGAILREAAPDVASDVRRRATAALRAREGEDEGVWSRLAPDLVPTLETLRAAGLQLGVISNAEGTVEEQLTRIGLRPYFETVIDSAVVRVEKPHARIFEIAMERTGARPDQTVHIGDFYGFDIVGARSAGIMGILMDPSETYRLHYPDVPAVTALTELPALLGVG